MDSIPESEYWILDRFLMSAERFTMAAYRVFRERLLAFLALVDEMASASLPMLGQ
jgi:predicted secreted protein